MAIECLRVQLYEAPTLIQSVNWAVIIWPQQISVKVFCSQLRISEIIERIC